tara:strand:- start:4257 stop:4745 length:489 start_codon:yes stop_codon:yes gene_type:complete
VVERNIKKLSKLNRLSKIGWIIGLIAIIVVAIYIWRLVGKPYYRISLMGTEYIENADQLSYANEHLEDNLILIKKYMYSKDVMLIGFGGGGSRTDDYFSYGLTNSNKDILIEPEYQFISSKVNSDNEVIIYGLPYIVKGNEKMMFYKIENGKLKEIPEKDSW